MRVRVLAMLAVTLFPLKAAAWFFFLIPGSVINGVADAITGDEGEHCVSRQAKIGDDISLPDGSHLVVKSLSGESSRCSNPARPIRAKLVPREGSGPMVKPAAAPQQAKPCEPAPPQLETPLSDPTRPPVQADGCSAVGSPEQAAAQQPRAQGPASSPAPTGVVPVKASTESKLPEAKPSTETQQPQEAKAPTPSTEQEAKAPTPSAADRLKRLERLRSEKLISDSEYEELRKKILNSL